MSEHLSKLMKGISITCYPLTVAYIVCVYGDAWADSVQQDNYSACGTSQSTNGATGITSHIYVDPVLRIESAFGDLSQIQIQEIEISDITYNGYPVHKSSLLAGADNLIQNGLSVTCKIPCGLLRQPGAYKFTVKASEYLPKVINIQATHKVFCAGSPSKSLGSTVIHIRLRHQ
jgi:hypothetical protein